MDNELSVTHERLDDIPVVFAMARRLKLPEILDEALGQHGNHEGLSYGWLATTWMAYMLVEGDHRKSVVEAWAERRRGVLERLTGQTLRPNELNDDRLGQLLTRLAEPQRWQAIEATLWQQSALAFDLRCERVRLDSTTSYGYHDTDEDGLMQLGHSKDHRPDKPQMKLMAAVAEPAGQMLSSEVHPGNVADDGLYVPMVERARQIVGKGMLYVGDAKMAAQKTREALSADGDDYLTRLPRPSMKHELPCWIDKALSGRVALESIEAPDGDRFGEGYAEEREVAGATHSWKERVLIYRSDAHARRQQKGLDERLAAATDAMLALSPTPGPGRKQLRSPQEWSKAITRVEDEHRVGGLLWPTWRMEPWPSRSDPDRERCVVVSVTRREDRIQEAMDQMGWQVLVTSLNAEQMSLPDAVRVYNGGWSIELQFRDIKNRPLGIRPLLVTRDDQITGLTHLILLALRIMTLITTTVRRSLQQSGETLRGLFEGQKSRVTDRPTARRLLQTFLSHEITLVRIRAPGQDLVHLEPLPDVLTAILKHLGLSESVYTDFASTAAQ